MDNIFETHRPAIMWVILDLHDTIFDGAHGWAIADTERGAWEKALDPCEDWSIRRSLEDSGLYAVEMGFSIYRIVDEEG